MFTPPLLTIARKQSQPRCPSVDGWIMKVYIHMMEYHALVDRNEFMEFSINGKWIELENIM